MPEGLNPIEAGKKLHEHGEAEQRAEEAEEKGGHGGSGGRHSRIVQICEAVLLALVTITAAWAGYSASKWSTASRIDIARASTLGNLATRDDLTAISLRNFDAATFNAWFIAFTLNSPQKEAIAVRRFRPQFLVAADHGNVLLAEEEPVTRGAARRAAGLPPAATRSSAQCAAPHQRHGPATAWSRPAAGSTGRGASG